MGAVNVSGTLSEIPHQQNSQPPGFYEGKFSSPVFYGRKPSVYSFLGEQILVSIFLWGLISSLQLVMGAVNVFQYSKGDITSTEFPVSSFLLEQIQYLQLSMGENF
ncbi:hypothetical protein V6N13_061422 [Hibiscus sabdariffa]